MKPEERIQLLKDEYVMLQQFYEDVDRRCLTIKSWSITVAIASIGAALLYSDHLYVGACAAALLFWYTEGFWRGLTYFVSQRIKRIEEALRSDAWKTTAPLQLYTVWTETYSKEGSQTWKYMLKEASRMPHVFVAAISALLYVLYLFGIDLGTR